MNLRLISVSVLAAVTTLATAQTETHNFSVKDDIAMSHFNDPSDAQEDFDSNHIKYSPDGRRVAVVTTRGLLDSDQHESTVSVFDLEEVESFLHDSSRHAPVRRIVAVITARTNAGQLAISATSLIRDLRWSSNSKQLYFRALNSLGAMQLDEVSADGTDLHRLTPSDYSVDRFDVMNGVVAYTAFRLGQPPLPQGEPINRDALAVTGYKLANILFPGQIPAYGPQNLILAVVRPGDDNNKVHQVPGYAVSDVPLVLSVYPFQLSPDGQQVIAVVPVLKVPENWRNYDPPSSYAQFRLDPNDPTLTKPDSGISPHQYVLINLMTGKIVPLVGGPNARTFGYALDLSRAAWSTDQSRILVTNVYLPLTAKGEDLSPSTEPCRIASVDLPSMQIRCFFYQHAGPLPDPDHIDAVQFGKDADQVLVFMKSSTTKAYVKKFHLQGETWVAEASTPIGNNSLVMDATRSLDVNPSSNLSIFIKQTLNDPPTLWASDRGTGSRQIWNPNPQLQQVRLGEASVYHWKDSSGQDWIGGLVKPVGYEPGKRYPAVIQMYVFHEDEFLTDGTDPTAFAARELASAGFVVLEVRKKPTVYSEVDPQTALEGYRSAIQSLSDAGLIDSQKVGVVGFSFTCWYAINALIKAPKLFAAATIADGLDWSYMQYILFAPSQGLNRVTMERIQGGSPFGATQDRWFRNSPEFHLDQVDAPVRIEAINPASVLQEWALYSSLYMQHKPVDMVYFPEGTHVHERPLERFESQQGNVDWMRFWLQGFEDPDPGKRAQYQRWEHLRELQKSENKADSQPTATSPN